jgi:hypothetical protein
MAAWAQVFATIIAVLVGGLVAYFFRDQQRAKVHEKRLDAYSRLWELTEEFRINGPPIDRERRQQLADKLTKWYFDRGGGMLLTGSTQTMFLRLRANLTCDPAAFTPSSWQALLAGKQDERNYSEVLWYMTCHTDADQARSSRRSHGSRILTDEQTSDRLRFLLLQRQFSVLRTQLKNDCATYYYGRQLSADELYKPYDLDFLKLCELLKVGVWKRAARKAKGIDEQCYLEKIKRRYQGTPDIPIRLGLAPGHRLIASKLSSLAGVSRIESNRQAGQDQLVVASLFKHKPEQCPFGHSLAPGRPQTVGWKPCIARQHGKRRGRPGHGSSPDLLRQLPRRAA